MNTLDLQLEAENLYRSRVGIRISTFNRSQWNLDWDVSICKLVKSFLVLLQYGINMSTWWGCHEWPVYYPIRGKVEWRDVFFRCLSKGFETGSCGMDNKRGEWIKRTESEKYEARCSLKKKGACRNGIIILWYQEESPLIPLVTEQRLVGKLNCTHQRVPCCHSLS